MNRRTLLRVAGSALATGAIAGCLSDGDGTAGGPGGDSGTSPGGTEPPATDRPPATRGDSDGDTPPGTDRGTEEAVFDSDAAEPFETATVGSRASVANPDDNRPHGVQIWNAAARERTLTVAVRRASATPFERTLAFPADGYLSLSLAEPAAYEVSIRADGERLGGASVETGVFDCNASTTNVGVMPDGEVRSRTISTTLACNTTDVVAPTIESEEGTCAGPSGHGSASVSVDDAGVEIDGRITAPNPCHRATIADTASRDGTLTITVGVTDAREGDTACVECVGSVGYTVTIDEVAAIEAVTVVHRGAAGEHTVATAER